MFCSVFVKLTLVILAVYLRLKPGQGLADIPPKVLMECGQLVKANSIKGNKLDDITVIYTLAANLRYTNCFVMVALFYVLVALFYV